jgi:hypothetical protein
MGCQPAAPAVRTEYANNLFFAFAYDPRSLSEGEAGGKSAQSNGLVPFGTAVAIGAGECLCKKSQNRCRNSQCRFMLRNAVRQEFKRGAGPLGLK